MLPSSKHHSKVTKRTFLDEIVHVWLTNKRHFKGVLLPHVVILRVPQWTLKLRADGRVGHSCLADKVDTVPETAVLRTQLASYKTNTAVRHMVRFEGYEIKVLRKGNRDTKETLPEVQHGGRTYIVAQPNEEFEIEVFKSEDFDKLVLPYGVEAAIELKVDGVDAGMHRFLRNRNSVVFDSFRTDITRTRWGALTATYRSLKFVSTEVPSLSCGMGGTEVRPISRWGQALLETQVKWQIVIQYETAATLLLRQILDRHNPAHAAILRSNGLLQQDQGPGTSSVKRERDVLLPGIIDVTLEERQRLCHKDEDIFCDVTGDSPIWEIKKKPRLEAELIVL